MSMYDRAPRSFLFLHSGTPKNIGPGSYERASVEIKCDPASYGTYLIFKYLKCILCIIFSILLTFGYDGPYSQ